MLACDKTVTFVRLNDSGEGYTCTTLQGVSWYAKTQIAVQDTGVVAANPVKIRIPADVLPESFMPRTGDFAVLGAVSAVEKQADLKALTHAKVLGVGDNRRGRLAHVAVVCE